MAYPVTLNGRTYTLADFEGQNYVDGLPDAFEDFVTHAGNLYSTTSTSSNSIALGSKTFTVESSKPYQVGTPLRISDAAAETTNWMDGIVTAYSGTTLTVDVVSYAGSGTKTSWNINIGGGAVSYSGTLPITQGGTGATTAAAARTNLDTYSKTEADSRFLNVSGEASDVTMNGNMTFGDSDKAIFGAGSDLQIYHDETSGNSFISESGTSNLKITGENIRLEDASGNRYAQGVAGGASSLYYAGAVKFSTTNAGVDITGDLNLGDNDKAIFGAGSDLQIYHDGDNSYISDEGAGELRLEASSRIRMMGNNGETLALFNEDGAVSLRHNNDPKIATTSTGVDVTGTLASDGVNVDGNVGIGTNDPNEALEVDGKIYINAAVPDLMFTDTNTGVDHRISGNSGVGNFTISVDENSEGTDPKLFVKIQDNTLFEIDEDGRTRFFNTTTETMRISSNGKVLVGRTTEYSDGSIGNCSIQTNAVTGAHAGIAVIATTTTGTVGIGFANPNGHIGNINLSGSATSYNTSSDYRLKTDAQPMTGASARVQALNPVNFEWIADGTRVDGFLAHEAQDVVPESVTGTKDAMRDEEYEVTPAVLDDDGNVVTEAVMGTRSVPDYQGIDQSKLVPLLTAALQEALTKIDDLETRLAALEG